LLIKMFKGHSIKLIFLKLYSITVSLSPLIICFDHQILIYSSSWMNFSWSPDAKSKYIVSWIFYK
jgi:hypothetical protein